MSSYSEVRRVRSEMSAAVQHKVRSLIAMINKRRSDAKARIIDPGREAEQTADAGHHNGVNADGTPTNADR